MSAAIIKRCLTVLFKLIVMYPSDKRPRLYAPDAAKKREKKSRLDNAVDGTSKIWSFCVTNNDGTSTTWRDSSGVRHDARPVA